LHEWRNAALLGRRQPLGNQCGQTEAALLGHHRRELRSAKSVAQFPAASPPNPATRCCLPAERSIWPSSRAKQAASWTLSDRVPQRCGRRFARSVRPFRLPPEPALLVDWSSDHFHFGFEVPAARRLCRIAIRRAASSRRRQRPQFVPLRSPSLKITLRAFSLGSHFFGRLIGCTRPAQVARPRWFDLHAEIAGRIATGDTRTSLPRTMVPVRSLITTRRTVRLHRKIFQFSDKLGGA
jgi:hypothetical protein